MKCQLLILIVALTLAGCSETENGAKQNQSDSRQAGTASTIVKGNLVLAENMLGSIPLPFPAREMTAELTQIFKGLSVSKEMGQQDGPDFPLYSIRQAQSELAYFEMDWEQTQKLTAVYVKHPFIKDQYGLAVGDSYEQIKQLRSGVINIQTDYHMHTYASIEGSNILYEISTNSAATEVADSDQIVLSEEQLRAWHIQQIIWRNSF